MLVALIWINFRRHAARVLAKSAATSDTTFLGLQAGGWYILVGALTTAPLLYALYRYRYGDRGLVPRSAFGKGTAVTLLLVWVTVAGQLLDGYPSRNSIIANLCLWLPAAVASCLLIRFTRRADQAVVPADAGVSPSDPRWRVGTRHALVCVLAPVLLLSITGLSLAMQDGPPGARGRLRFGPNAYWRQTARLQGAWKAVHLSSDLTSTEIRTGDLPLAQLEFDAYRNVVVTLPSGERVEAHRWFLKNQYIWLQWYGKVGEHSERAEVPLQFRDQRLYITWPPHEQNEGYLVLERVDD